jgi:hypothetical protein
MPLPRSNYAGTKMAGRIFRVIRPKGLSPVTMRVSSDGRTGSSRFKRYIVLFIVRNLWMNCHY